MSVICWEVYVASDLTKKKIFFKQSLELADLDLQDLGALVTDPTPALNFLIGLQTVKNDIDLLPYTVHMSA